MHCRTPRSDVIAFLDLSLGEQDDCEASRTSTENDVVVVVFFFKGGGVGGHIERTILIYLIFPSLFLTLFC